MSKILAFTNFIKDRDFAIEDLAQFADLIDPIAHEDKSVGYRIRPLGQADRITHRCKQLVFYTWHCRDYLKKVLEQHGISEPGRLVNDYIRKSQDIQVVSYLANKHKHCETNETQRWATELAPRYDKPYVHGIMRTFPHRLKPTLMIWGDSIPDFEFVGSASVGDLKFKFDDFSWTFSCTVVDKNGRSLGNVASICDNAFKTWLDVLNDNKISLE